MDLDGYGFLSLDVRDRILFITFNRPDKLNACDGPGHDEMPRVLRAFGESDDVDVAVVTGAGRAFSIGGDFDLVGARPEVKETIDSLRATRTTAMPPDPRHP